MKVFQIKENNLNFDSKNNTVQTGEKKLGEKKSTNKQIDDLDL